MKASNYRASKGEANFGRPITTQLVGGTHITFELITRKGKTLFATRWPKGLPGHDDPPNVLRFPHGLIRFGETIEDCAKRLVKDQLGMNVRSVKMAYMDSYVDDKQHWHIEPGCVVEVDGKPRVPRAASEIVRFTLAKIPELSFWTKEDLLETLEANVPELLK